MSSKHSSVPVDHDRVMSAAFIEYSSRTTERDDLTKWFEEHVVPLDGIKTMLCVGCGSGFDLCLALRIKGLTHVTMLDPNKAQLEVAMKAISVETATIEVKCLSFEEFIPEIQYDLILFSHVLYYIPERMAALRKAMVMLTDGGFILIFHQTEHGINELQHLFNSTKYSYCFKDLEEELVAENIAHKASIIDSVFRIDRPTKELCDFILDKNTSEVEYRQLSRYLRGLGPTLYQASAAIIIHGPSNSPISLA